MVGNAALDQDMATGFYWKERAADNGLAAAQYNVSGLRLLSSLSLSLVVVVLATAPFMSLNEPLRSQLAVCYIHGHGVRKDLLAASDYLRRAVEQGHPRAASLYANMKTMLAEEYTTQQFTTAAEMLKNETDDSKATGSDTDRLDLIEKIHLCADLGHGPAQFKEAELYATGNGVEQNLETAVEKFKIAGASNPMLPCSCILCW